MHRHPGYLPATLAILTPCVVNLKITAPHCSNTLIDWPTILASAVRCALTTWCWHAVRSFSRTD